MTLQMNTKLQYWSCFGTLSSIQKVCCAQLDDHQGKAVCLTDYRTNGQRLPSSPSSVGIVNIHFSQLAEIYRKLAKIIMGFIFGRRHFKVKAIPESRVLKYYFLRMNFTAFY